jgi:uncharacterized protein
MVPPPEASDAELDPVEPATPRLDSVEIRILGCLVEKQSTTPDVYPLSLNALVVACNQTTNRDPVTSYDEGVVTRALEHLRAKGFVWAVTGSRVPKYEHRLREKLELSGARMAAMCVLMLRGPQTAGEIRGRTGRLHGFAGLEEVEATLESLRTSTPPRVAKLPRLPGTKEPRYAHLLGDEPATAGSDPVPPPMAAAFDAGADLERIARLEAEVIALRGELDELRSKLAELKSASGA